MILTSFEWLNKLYSFYMVAIVDIINRCDLTIKGHCETNPLGVSCCCIELLRRHDLVRLPHFTCTFIAYHHDMSGKELEHYMAISPMTLLLPSSSKYVH